VPTLQKLVLKPLELVLKPLELVQSWPLWTGLPQPKLWPKGQWALP
jgi:hypothetical protein